MVILITFITLIFAIGFFMRSIMSRKYYVCPHCGESFRTEHMNSKCCKVCGTPLEETDDTNVNDSAL